MRHEDTKSQFETTLIRPAKTANEAQWAFVILPKHASKKLARRGRTTIKGSINNQTFETMLEPDGQLSHWFWVSKALLEKADVNIDDLVSFEIMALEQEPEPEVPADLHAVLVARPEALAVWDDTTTIARLDWIHWITSAKQSKTRTKRISDACAMLTSGKRRVCCFDPSGFYSKAFSAPKAAD